MSLTLAGWPYFCLVLKAIVLGLTVGLAIGTVEFIGKKVAVGFSRCSLWKVVTSL